MKRERRKIIKEKAGELGHIDCHYLPKGLIEGSSKGYYLVGLIDSCTRVAWAEVVEDIKSLAVLEPLQVFFPHSTALSWIHFPEQDFSGIIFFHPVDDL